MELAAIEPWMQRWTLVGDGLPFRTAMGSVLAPVVWRGRRAMLKITAHSEEIIGGELMAWFGGEGAAMAYLREGEALLLERLAGDESLAAMAAEGRDPEAVAILCDTAAILHAPKSIAPPRSLVPLEPWFRALRTAATAGGDGFELAASMASELLADPRDPVALHGDLHHFNVLDGEERGWLAIDPKGLWGERAFEFAALFRNPTYALASVPDVMEQRLNLISQRAGLDRRRLSQWVTAACGLSAAWSLESGADPRPALALAQCAAAQS